MRGPWCKGQGGRACAGYRGGSLGIEDTTGKLTSRAECCGLGEKLLEDAQTRSRGSVPRGSVPDGVPGTSQRVPVQAHSIRTQVWVHVCVTWELFGFPMPRPYPDVPGAPGGIRVVGVAIGRREGCGVSASGKGGGEWGGLETIPRPGRCCGDSEEVAGFGKTAAAPAAHTGLPRHEPVAAGSGGEEGDMA